MTPAPGTPLPCRHRHTEGAWHKDVVLPRTNTLLHPDITRRLSGGHGWLPAPCNHAAPLPAGTSSLRLPDEYLRAWLLCSLMNIDSCWSLPPKHASVLFPP